MTITHTMASAGWRCALLVLGALTAAGCGGDGPEEAADGDADADGDGDGDADGDGDGDGDGDADAGTPVDCPAGAHDDGAGVCVTTFGEWTQTAPIAARRDHHVTFAMETEAGPFLYVMGGAADMTDPVTSVERSAIQDDGSLAAWETLPDTPVVIGATVVSAGQRVLLAGGLRPGGFSAEVDLFTIDAAGELGAIEAGPAMNEARFHGATVLVDGWVYASGGVTSEPGAAEEEGHSTASIDRAPFDETGLGDWIASTPFPEPRSHHALVAHGHSLYAIGGLNRARLFDDTDLIDVLRADIAEDGSLGEWSAVGEYPSYVAVHAAFVLADSMYVVGGLTSGGGHDHERPEEFSRLVSRATFGAEGEVGEWEELEPLLPIARGHCHQVPVVNGVVYSVGGHDLGMSQSEAFFARLE